MRSLLYFAAVLSFLVRSPGTECRSIAFLHLRRTLLATVRVESVIEQCVAYSLIACSMAGEVQGLIADSSEEWATPPQRMVRGISVTQAGDLASVLLGFDNADDLSDGWVDLYTLLRIDRLPTPVDLDTLSPYFAEYRARSRE